MNLKQFHNQKKTQKFIEIYNGDIVSKAFLVKKIEGKVTRWIADGSSRKEIRDIAIKSILNNYEPYTRQLVTKTKKMMKEFGF